MAKTTVHRSNRNLHTSKKSNFLYWAGRNPKEAWEQAQEQQETKPWQMQALRSDEGKAVAAAIKTAYLDALMAAEAKLASFPKPSPASKAARADLRKARQRYVEVQAALSPRRRYRK